MLSPSTAPRWKRQTNIRRSDGPADGRTAKAARARNNGSRPRLNSASPPDFTNTRLEIDIIPSSNLYRLLPPSPALSRPLPSLPLKLRSANREADCECPRLHGVADACQLAPEHLLRVLGHRSTENLLVHYADQLFGASCRNDGVERDRHALQLARGERDGGVHPVEQRTAVHPRRFPLGIPVGSDVEIEWLAEARHDLRQPGRGVRLGIHRPRCTDHELERCLHLGAHVLRRPEVGAVKK